MNAEREKLLRGLQEAREEGNEHLVSQCLLLLSESTPLFADHVSEVKDWIRESRDLAVRTVLPPRQEIGQVLRSAECFLAEGSARTAFDIATEGCQQAHNADLPSLEDRGWIVSSRALVRLGRQDDAVGLFHQIVDRELAPEEEDPIVPGLAFVAVGEAHLFEGRYDGAHGPLERAVGLLPENSAADRYRYDALVGLGMLDHRLGSFDTAALRYSAAMQLADTHESRPEQVESQLLMGSLCRGQGDRVAAHQHLKRALTLSKDLSPPMTYLHFPTERLRNLIGCADASETIDAATELARDCGGRGDLMGYVQLTSIVAALVDFDGRPGEAKDMLTQVSAGLEEGGQSQAALVLRQHLEAYK